MTHIDIRQCRSRGLAFTLTFVLAAMTACGGSEAAPADSIEGTTTETDSQSGTNPSATTPSDETADETAGPDTDDPSDPTATGTTGGEECLGENDCWGCAPQTPTQVLNACTDASCEAFDNAARLPLLEPDGSLPPLP